MPPGVINSTYLPDACINTKVACRHNLVTLAVYFALASESNRIDLWSPLVEEKAAMKKEPNIIITGTPGVGKTSHCELLAQNTALKHMSINQVVKERNCYEEWDEVYQSYIVDEDKVCIFRFPLHIKFARGTFLLTTVVT